ncbi:hypothetical protein OE88DRAFT_1665098 [Heliocybe sulcata]|uniref:Cyclin-like domain-containing protein n=1 Tax=Heliocybe sulcata TaxID=5364 RepID=A0A5C3MST8_9AGAM|nr:hypothetical protein OE88DRAFT_1665098 [Heliocybe sulcata]
MALYTPPSLPHTPSSYAMHRNSSSLLPTELLAATTTWSTWRQPKLEMPLTPPRSVPARRADRPQVTVLPPISHLDRSVSRISPLTPPPMEDIPIASTSSTSRSQHTDSSDSSDMDDYQQAKPSIPSPAPHLVDWFSSSQKRSAHFIAEKTCEMICYLWFANNSAPASKSSLGSTRARDHSPCASSPPYIPQSNPQTASLQLVASPAFVNFMQKLLETTQVSQSVIVLSLHYIYRLKERNRFTNGQQGSEFRVAVAALMMANKFVDDNTYTNKTWSEISSISLNEINKMEREFLMGVDFDLYVDKSTYESWLNLLKGLVMAKEKDSRRWHRGRGKDVRAIGRVAPATAHRPSARSRQEENGGTTRRYRARSTSPISRAPTYSDSSYHHFTFALPPMPSTAPRSTSSYPYPSPGKDYIDSPVSPTPHPGSKRSANTAFSHSYEQHDTSLPPPPPAKRPTSMRGLTLEIPEFPSVKGSLSGPGAAPSPMESLQGFSKLSLTSEGIRTPGSSSLPKREQPQTLAAAYRAESGRSGEVPHSLYYYSLACSPTEEDHSDNSRCRKAKLRVHHAPAAAPNSYYATSELASCPQQPANSHSAYQSSYGEYQGPRIPMVVQSASTSPDMSMPEMPLPPHPQVKRYETSAELYAWSRRASEPNYETPTHSHSTSRSPYEGPIQDQDYHRRPEEPRYAGSKSPVPSAPFANAGPPGVQLYTPPNSMHLQPPTHLLQYRPSQQYVQRSSPDFTYFQWPSDRGRRLYK